MRIEDPITLCCLLWARGGAAEAMSGYEDRVLALLPGHGAEPVSRVIGARGDGAPNEVQTFSFPLQAALDAYREDPERAALANVRERVVERTQLFPVWDR